MKAQKMMSTKPLHAVHTNSNLFITVQVLSSTCCCLNLGLCSFVKTYSNLRCTYGGYKVTGTKLLNFHINLLR